ncbi:hypothetical protein CSPAE12_11171 [Colletotrichum incanum]|nr:hypothetical protein CSPAE12_11171 [Colletotrichum incanum]
MSRPCSPLKLFHHFSGAELQASHNSSPRNGG